MAPLFYICDSSGFPVSDTWCLGFFAFMVIFIDVHSFFLTSSCFGWIIWMNRLSYNRGAMYARYNSREFLNHFQGHGLFFRVFLLYLLIYYFALVFFSFNFRISLSMYDLHWLRTSDLMDCIWASRFLALMVGADEVLLIFSGVLLGVIMTGFGCFFRVSNVCVVVVFFILGGLSQALVLGGVVTISGCLIWVVFTSSDISWAPQDGREMLGITSKPSDSKFSWRSPSSSRSVFRRVLWIVWYISGLFRLTICHGS